MRKGQAALEFLTTYGWAFLVILVMIGALAGFGILSPKNLLPNRCNLGPELSCEEAQVTYNNSLVYVIRNSMSDSITINSETATIDGMYINKTGSHCNVTPATLVPGITAKIICPYNNTDIGLPVKGDKAKIAVEIKYTPVGKKLKQTVKGEIFQSVQ